MEVEQPVARVIKAKKVKDGFTFQLSIDHIIEQTLLKEYKSKRFAKTLIRIEDGPSDSESDTSDSSDTAKLNTRPKGVPIKLQLKRQYAEDCPTAENEQAASSVSSNQSADEPLDMSTKKVKKDRMTPAELLDYNMVTPIPPTWIMRGLSREDHKKFQSAVSNASLSPYQRRSKSAES